MGRSSVWSIGFRVLSHWSDFYLDENAVNLVYGFLSLNDPYELEGFSEKRQGAMNALVACAPKKAAP